jgi:hypothetical protein
MTRTKPSFLPPLSLQPSASIPDQTASASQPRGLGQGEAAQPPGWVSNLITLPARQLLRTTPPTDPPPHAPRHPRSTPTPGRVPEVTPGAPGWNEALASESEAVVKADRVPSMDFSELQQRSIEALSSLEATHPDAEAAGHPQVREFHRISQEPPRARFPLPLDPPPTSRTPHPLPPPCTRRSSTPLIRHPPAPTPPRSPTAAPWRAPTTPAPPRPSRPTSSTTRPARGRTRSADGDDVIKRVTMRRVFRMRLRAAAVVTF